MFSFTHMMNFFSDEFTGLRAGRFSLFGILSRALDSFLVGHFSPRWGMLPAASLAFVISGTNPQKSVSQLRVYWGVWGV